MRKLIKRSASQRVVFVVVFVLFCIYSICLIYPYLFAFNAALKESGRIFTRDMVSISNPAKWSNFSEVFSEFIVSDSNYFVMTWNSIWYSFGGTMVKLITVTLSSYVVCKYHFKGREIIYNTLIFTMILPIAGSGPAMYKLLSDLNFIESPKMVLTFAGGLMDLMLFAYFKSIPWEYAEAAFIDGAGHFKVFYKIMLPQALPAISVIFIMTVVTCWNDYSAPILYMNERYPTLASGLYSFHERIRYSGKHPVFFAGALFAIIPPLTIFIAFQNSIMDKVFLGGLKG